MFGPATLLAAYAIRNMRARRQSACSIGVSSRSARRYWIPIGTCRNQRSQKAGAVAVLGQPVEDQSVPDGLAEAEHHGREPQPALLGEHDRQRLERVRER